VAKSLLIVTALLETTTGLTLMLSPTLVAALLLGRSLDAPVALVVGRVGGAALLSLGVACWLAWEEGPGRVVRNMRLTPFGPGIVLGLVVSALAPMTPLLLFQFSPDELLLQLAKLLFGG
jgi:hypothetical protein